ncbi:alpha/beta hydrolase [Glycomyces sp. NPDC046736]|uniref:alpha/beta hydrolase family protein n=1 Tax=Glycomyces sp. NPDC046736 TaxID=3155615 RepID=UPI0033E0E83D
MEPLNVEHDGRTLRGVLHLPQPHREPVPAVVLCHGFGGNRMEFGNVFVHLSRRLAARGLAAVRFDFAGCGESDGDIADLTVSDQVDQVLAVVDQLSRHSALAARRVSLVGMSLGAIAASLAAAKCAVQSLAMWAPPALALAATGPADEPTWDEIRQRGFRDHGGVPVHRKCIEDGFGIDAFADAAAYAGPVLFASGTEDPLVPGIVRDRYLEVYGDRFEAHRFDGVGHAFETVPARERLLETTVEFTVRHA